MLLKFNTRLDYVELVRILRVSGDVRRNGSFIGNRPIEITTTSGDIEIKTAEGDIF